MTGVQTCALPIWLTLNTFAAYFKYAIFMPYDNYMDVYHSKSWFQSKFDADMLVGMIRNYKTDLVAFAWYNLDPASHYMWIYHEPEKFGHARGVIEPELLKKYGNFINDEYIWADRSLEVVMKRLPPTSRFAIVSDHGFGFDKRPMNMLYVVRKDPMLKFAGLEGKVTANVMGEEFILKPVEGAEFPDGVAADEYIAGKFTDITIRELDRPFFTVDVLPVGVRVTRYSPNKLVDLSETNLVLGKKTTMLKNVIMAVYASGVHYEKGIIILSGEHINPGVDLGDNTMADFAPTLSVWLGLPFPVDTDGYVIEGALSKE